MEYSVRLSSGSVHLRAVRGARLYLELKACCIPAMQCARRYKVTPQERCESEYLQDGLPNAEAAPPAGELVVGSVPAWRRELIAHKAA